MIMQRTILLAVSHFDNTPEVERFLRHISQFELPGDWRLDVAIADNSGTLNLSEGLLQRTTVYQPGDNLGYLRGCSYAINQWVEERGQYPDWLGVTNTDIEFGDEYFDRLISILPPEGVCCIAPDILLQNGLRQNPHMRKRPSRLEMYAYTLIYRSPFVTAVLDRLYYIFTSLKSWLKSNDQTASLLFEIIYAPHGSCVMFHRTFFERGGGINFKGFMYGEEIYIGEEARRRNLKIAWAPGLKVLHYKKATTGKVLHAEKVRWRLEISKILWDDYFAKG